MTASERNALRRLIDARVRELIAHTRHPLAPGETPLYALRDEPGSQWLPFCRVPKTAAIGYAHSR